MLFRSRSLSRFVWSMTDGKTSLIDGSRLFSTPSRYFLCGVLNVFGALLSTLVTRSRLVTMIETIPNRCRVGHLVDLKNVNS